MTLNYLVDNNCIYINVRSVLINKFNISYRLITKLKKENKILLNKETTYLDKTLVLGDNISINLDFEEDNSNIVSNKMDLNIIYEDDSFLIIDKPAKIPVHPSNLHYTDTISNGLKYYFDTIRIKKKNSSSK